MLNDELDSRLGGGMVSFKMVATVAEVFAAAAINSPGMISSEDLCDPVTTSSVVADSAADVEFVVVGMYFIVHILHIFNTVLTRMIARR